MVSAKNSANRHVKGLLVVITVLLFSVSIVVNCVSADQNTSQIQLKDNQGTSPYVFSNMSSTTLVK